MRSPDVAPPVVHNGRVSFRPSVDTIDPGVSKDQARAGVLVSVWPECGEATAVMVSPPGLGDGLSPWMQLSEEQRARLNAEKSLHRSKSAARRYAVANRLTKNWTLTFAGAGVFSRRFVVRRVNRFLTTLRHDLGERFPYLYVIELHPGGHGYHVHLLLDSRFISKHKMQRLWGGIVHFSEHRKRGNQRQSARQQARIAVGYLMKYLSKDWTPGSGEHRYERSTGFNGEKRQRWFSTFGQAMAWVRSVRGPDQPVLESFDSRAWEEWFGPPVMWVAW